MIVSVAPTMTTATPQRILCLHGYRQDGAIFHAKTGALRRALRDVANLHCIDAPHTGPSRLAWWNSSDDGSVYEGYRSSLAHVVSANERDGPFDGVLGFSQGGVFASILAGLVPTTPSLQSLKYAILISAFPARAAEISGSMWYNKIDLPSLHVWGNDDTLVPPQGSALLRDRFSDPVTHVHDKGHVVPGNSAFTTAVRTFVSSRTGNLSRI